MKKFGLLIFILSIGSVTVNSQDVHFGIKGGLNVSSIETSGGSDYASRVGANFGGLAHIHLTKYFALQPELVYSWQRAHLENSNRTLKLNYFNIPVIGQYMINNGFRFQTGPQIGFLTLAKLKTDNVEYNSLDEFHHVDFSWVFGVSYIFPENFGIDARFNLGLSDIADNERNISAKNRVFQIGVFYQFMNHINLKKK